MKVTSYIFLLSREFKRNKGRTFSVVFSLFVASFFLLLAYGLLNGIGNHILPELEKAFPEKLLLARPKTLSLGGIRLDTVELTPDIGEKIKKIKGVEFVSPQITLSFPSRAISQIFGNLFSTDVVVIGVEERVVAPHISEEKDFIYMPGKPIPVLTSQYFLNLYNLGLSDSMSLPKFNASSAVGREFTLVLGESTLSDIPTSKSRVVNCELIGFTPDISLIGLILPLESVVEFNKWFWGEGRKTEYSLLRVGVDSVDDIERVIEHLKALKLDVSSNVDELNRFRFNLRLVGILVLIFVSSIAVVALLNIVNTTTSIYRETTSEVALFRLLGFTSTRYFFFISGQRCITAFVGGIAGSLSAFLVAHFLNTTIARSFKDLPFIPQTLLDIPPLSIPVMVILAIVLHITITALIYMPSIQKVPARFLKGM